MQSLNLDFQKKVLNRYRPGTDVFVSLTILNPTEGYKSHKIHYLGTIIGSHIKGRSLICFVQPKETPLVFLAGSEAAVREKSYHPDIQRIVSLIPDNIDALNFIVNNIYPVGYEAVPDELIFVEDISRDITNQLDEGLAKVTLNGKTFWIRDIQDGLYLKGDNTKADCLIGTVDNILDSSSYGIGLNQRCVFVKNPISE